MRTLRWLLLACTACASLSAFASDVDEARALFEKNLAAIQRRDRAAYLACYLDSERLVRTSPDGQALGFTDFEKQAGTKWPDTLEAADLQLVPVREGIVYGTYRYRVRYGGDEHAGISERLFMKTPKGWKIAVTSAFEAPPSTPPPPRAFTGATLVDGTGAPPVKDAVVLVRGGKIECAGTRAACPVPSGVDVTDLSGAFLAPGLIDAHVHFAQTGWADGRPDAFDVRAKHPYEDVQKELRSRPERFFRSYLCSGVTSVFDVGGFAWSLDLPARAENDTLAPRVRAAGPLLSTIDFWLNLPAERQFIFLRDEEAAKAGVAYLASRGAQAVKVWYVVTADRPVEASEAAVLAAGAEAKKKGLPLIVHATGLAEAKVALRAGASLLVHGVMDKPVDDEFLDLLKASVALKVRDREVRTAERKALGLANLKRVRDAGIPIAMGTDAGNPGTLHGPSVYAEMEAMQAAGLTPMEVLVASTRGGSRALLREKEIGTVEKGKLADLVVFAKDPLTDIANARTVKGVVRGGVYRTSDELRAIVAAEGK